MKKLVVLSLSLLAVGLFNVGISEKAEAASVPSSNISLVENIFDPLTCTTTWETGGTVQLDLTDGRFVQWNINLDKTSAKIFQGVMMVRPLRGGRISTFRISGKTGKVDLRKIPAGGVTISLDGRAIGEDGIKYSTVSNALSI